MAVSEAQGRRWVELLRVGEADEQTLANLVRTFDRPVEVRQAVMVPRHFGELRLPPQRVGWLYAVRLDYARGALRLLGQIDAPVVHNATHIGLEWEHDGLWPVITKVRTRGRRYSKPV